MIDDKFKSFAIDENASVEQLRTAVIEKLELAEQESFALFEKREDVERCLEPDEKPCELVSEWGLTNEKDKKRDGSEPKILFKKKLFLRDDDREMRDSVAKHYIYIQALYSVIQSEYPCSVDDALTLAGLQVQVTYGDHNPTTHIPGFLTHNLQDYVPKQLIQLKSAKEWETLIFKAHARNTGKSAEDAKGEYLDIVKLWPFYGTTFYPPCKTVSSGKTKLPAKVIIGVNAEGILLLKAKDKELISTHPFTEICSWASSATTFAFEFGSTNESTKYSFETKQGANIASTIQTYIDILVQMLKNGESDDEEESNSNSTD
jgi:hypothetical protein